MSKKTVVLAEKPSVGRDIARVLNCHKKGNNSFEGKQYIVTWALGHLVTLAEPEQYDNKYKNWVLEDLPMLPSPMKLMVMKKTGKQFHAVKSLLHRNDVKDVVIATDAGREGELVARWILKKAKVKKPIKRLWISSVTDKAIQDGFRHLKDGRKYDSLYFSAVARAEADWYVGINGTRALTAKYNAQLSCGRVQTPTLAMVAAREKEIKAFKPRTYYGVAVTSQKGEQWVWEEPRSNSQRTFNEKRAEQALQKVKLGKGNIEEVKTKRKKSYAPPLFDLTELQREANKRFGFSAKETLSTMQGLYERHKVLTYPRTDSKYLSSDIVSTFKDRIKASGPALNNNMTTNILKQKLTYSPAIVNDKKVTDHHAIIPTEVQPNLHKMSAKERKIYDLVVGRFIAVFLPPYQYEQTVMKANIAGETFIARGKKVIAKGWKQIFSNEEETTDDNEQSLPDYEQGDTFTIQSATMTSGETRPPAPFTEATLLSAMENPSSYMDHTDSSLIKTIGKTGGIGTVATRADIIEKLFNSFLIEKRGHGIHTTSKGRQLLDLVPEELKSPALTAEWEQKLDAVAQGNLDKQSFIADMKGYAKTVVMEIKQSDKKFKHDNMTGSKCPECGKWLLEVKTKKGKMKVCQDRQCGYRKNIAKITNARCPQCKKKMELRGEGEGQIFVCKCGYKEKKAAFERRRQKEKEKKASKKDINKYLKKQDNDEMTNPALADALAKLKKDKE